MRFFKFNAAAFLAAIVTTTASAGTVLVPYIGAYDEATGTEAAGDYDNIGGGLPDVGLFNLVAGSNTFAGSVWSPGDTSDVFAIGIGANQTLTGASIAFGENLTPFAPMFAFPAPIWTLEESSVTPTIFSQTLGFDGMGSVQNSSASFTRGEGVYTFLIGNGTFGVNAGNFDTPIDYTITFTVDELITPPAVIPLPPALPMLGAAILGLGLIRRKGR